MEGSKFHGGGPEAHKPESERSREELIADTEAKVREIQELLGDIDGSRAEYLQNIEKIKDPEKRAKFQKIFEDLDSRGKFRDPRGIAEAMVERMDGDVAGEEAPDTDKEQLN